MDVDVWPPVRKAPSHVAETTCMHRMRGSHARKIGHSHLSHPVSNPPISSSESNFPIGNNPTLEEFPLSNASLPITYSDIRHTIASPPLSQVPKNSTSSGDSPRCSLKPSIGAILPLSKYDFPNENPIFITSLDLPPAGEGDVMDRHLMVVDKIVDALSNPMSSNHLMDGSFSEISESMEEPDDDMILSHFQTKAKLEALTRRDPSKSGT